MTLINITHTTMITEQIYISKEDREIFRFTCTDKNIPYKEVMENEDGVVYELTLHNGSQLFYLGREYQVNLWSSQVKEEFKN